MDNATLCFNLTAQIRAILRSESRQPEYYDDSANSYKYIVFVLVVYAVLGLIGGLGALTLPDPDSPRS